MTLIFAKIIQINENGQQGMFKVNRGRWNGHFKVTSIRWLKFIEFFQKFFWTFVYGFIIVT